MSSLSNDFFVFVVAFTEDEIYVRINQVYDMTLKELAEAGKKGYDFVVKWHEQTLIIDKHIDIVKEVYATAKQNEK